VNLFVEAFVADEPPRQGLVGARGRGLVRDVLCRRRCGVAGEPRLLSSLVRGAGSALTGDRGGEGDGESEGLDRGETRPRRNHPAAT